MQQRLEQGEEAVKDPIRPYVKLIVYYPVFLMLP